MKAKKIRSVMMQSFKKGSHFLRSHRERQKRKCNLCSKGFRPHKSFERFCRQCRTQDELLRFYESIPQVEINFWDGPGDNIKKTA